MPALLIKGLPPEIHRRLKEEALRNRRSMTQQAIAVLERSLEQRPEPSLVEVKPAKCRLRITDAWLRQAKKWGRP